MVVAEVTNEGSLRGLGHLHELPDGHLLVAVIGALGAVGVGRDGKAVGQLDVSVAAQGREHGWMVAVQAAVVAGPPEQAGHVALAGVRHAPVLGQAGANKQQLVRQPIVPGEARLALRRVLWIAAVLQGLSHAVGIGMWT